MVEVFLLKVEQRHGGRYQAPEPSGNQETSSGGFMFRAKAGAKISYSV